MSSEPTAFLDRLGLSQTQKDVFDIGMEVLDKNYRPPLLWASAKLSSWYSIGLLARGRDEDIKLANKLLSNALLMQDLDPAFEQNYGSFKAHLSVPYSSGEKPLWIGSIYESYDPNNALFVTLAGIMVEEHFPQLVDENLRKKLRAAMHTACKANAKRKGGRHGDDMWPSYTNPWFLRCVCTTYTAHLVGDEELGRQAEEWAREAVELFDLYDTPGEFNSPTYAGVTLMAMAMGQYCPEGSLIRQVAPRLIKALWESLAEVYNPSLLNVAGPWDRAYGYCLTQYYATCGANITSIIGMKGNYPIPRPLIGAEHEGDAALIPMQMITAPFTEAPLTDEIRSKFIKLYKPHMYTPLSIFPPHDKRPRKYTFWLEEGLNVGGIDFDEDRLGGPKGDQTQYNPGVIQWDSGDHGAGCGWITVWPDNACCSMVASSKTLVIKYLEPVDFPGSPESDRVTLHIGCLPFMQFNGDSFSTGNESLPGLEIRLSGNVVEEGTRSLTFAKSTQLHGAHYYELSYRFPNSFRGGNEPTLVIELEKTAPPRNSLLF